MAIHAAIYRVHDDAIGERLMAEAAAPSLKENFDKLVGEYYVLVPPESPIEQAPTPRCPLKFAACRRLKQAA